MLSLIIEYNKIKGKPINNLFDTLCNECDSELLDLINKCLEMNINEIKTYSSEKITDLTNKKTKLINTINTSTTRSNEKSIDYLKGIEELNKLILEQKMIPNFTESHFTPLHI